MYLNFCFLSHLSYTSRKGEEYVAVLSLSQRPKKGSDTFIRQSYKLLVSLQPLVSAACFRLFVSCFFQG